MLRFLPGTLLGLIAYALLVTNLVMHFFLIIVPSFLKKTFPNSWIAKPCYIIMVFLVKTWVCVNLFILKLTANPKLVIHGKSCLPEKNSSVMVISNHRSAADIVLKQFAYNWQLPMMKFFVKSQLRKTPLLGYVWDAFDMPFLKRHSKSHLAENPTDKGKDFSAIINACEKFRGAPVTVISYLEGTRITPEKHEEQGKEFKHLLTPKAGGMACVLAALKGQLVGILDVTLCYNPELSSFWDLYSGKVKQVTINTKYIEIPDWVKNGDYVNDDSFRQRFRAWLHVIWQEKDACYAELLNSM